jgi:tetratricopeptide (TPR) repeat protein
MFTSMRYPLLLLAPLFLVGCQSDGEPTAEQKEKMLELYTETAQSYYQMGEVERAAGQAEKGLLLDPDNQQLKLVLAWSLQRRGKTEDVARAEGLFRETASSGDFRALLGMGDALERKGLAYAEAADKIESGDRVTEAADPQQRVQELRAKANACWREALDWYRQTIAKQADNSDAHGGLTRVHTLLGERREALAAADRALEIVTADYAFWEQRVRAPDVRIEEEKRMRSLLGRLQKILIATHMTAYQLCVELDQKAAALGHLDAALALDPERADAYSRRAQLRLEAADYAGAAKDIDAFLARSALAFEHPDMKKAWQIRREAEAGLKRQPASKP